MRNGTFYSSIYLSSGQGISCHFYFSRARYGFRENTPPYAIQNHIHQSMLHAYLPFLLFVVISSHFTYGFSRGIYPSTFPNNTDEYFFLFYVLLTVHLSIILVINQINAQNLFYNKFIICLYMFRALCAHRQEVKIVLYSIWYRHNCRWPSGVQVERGLVLFCAREGHL